VFNQAPRYEDILGSYQTKFRDSKLSAASVAPTSDGTTTILMLLTVGNLKIQKLDGLMWHDVNAKFYEIPSVSSEVLRG
jgi:hypothetical protein